MTYLCILNDFNQQRMQIYCQAKLIILQLLYSLGHCSENSLTVNACAVQ